MPRGDGSGPGGFGPMTGRGMGFCAGYDAPGYMNPPGPAGFGRGGFYGRGAGFGGGRGFGRGGGFGWRNRYYATGLPGWARAGYYGGYGSQGASPEGYSPENEIDYLNREADYLKRELEEIDKRVSELKKKNKEG